MRGRRGGGDCRVNGGSIDVCISGMGDSIRNKRNKRHFFLSSYLILTSSWHSPSLCCGFL
jgi:hypothetical protein